MAAWLLFGTSSLAHADTVWQCWHDKPVQVACVLSQSASATGGQEQRPGLTQVTTINRPGQLPPLVNAVLNTPDSLRGQIIRIPLHSKPTDHQFVAELAQDVMCGKKVDCRAVYSEQPTRQLASAMAIADAIDPVLRDRP